MKTILYFIGLLVVLLLLSMATSVTHKKPTGRNPYLAENFHLPDKATKTQVTSGSSSLYGWGYTPIHESEAPKKEITCPQCSNIFIIPPSERVCRDCDITKNKDIDKYVLKSSIPPCPDMSLYAKKNMLPPGFDPNKYIRKSEIPPCPRVDMSQYILKSEVPRCPEPPKCPVCPLNPIQLTEKVVYR